MHILLDNASFAYFNIKVQKIHHTKNYYLNWGSFMLIWYLYVKIYSIHLRCLPLSGISKVINCKITILTDPVTQNKRLVTGTHRFKPLVEITLYKEWHWFNSGTLGVCWGGCLSLHVWQRLLNRIGTGSHQGWSNTDQLNWHKADHSLHNKKRLM